MKIWFVHQNFPGQYRNLAPHFASSGDHEVVTIGENLRAEVKGAHQFQYKAPRGPSDTTHPYIRNLEGSVRRGQEAARLALELKKKGLVPEIICSHPGWGDTLYFRELFPDAKFLSYFEFFYQPTGADVGFDEEFSTTSLDDLCRVRTKNTTNLLTLETADWGISPTKWQHSQFPEHYKSRISVIHDGVDTQVAKPDPNVKVTLGRDNQVYTRNDEIITYIARNLEPYRGFHIFMRALPDLMKRRPKAHFFVVGGNEVSYGRALPEGETYRQKMLDEVRGELDMSRIHFFGRVPYSNFVNILQISSVHIYLTYPFVLSWSMLESMASGGLIVGSRTPPVEEVIRDGENGLLFDFFSPQELAEKVGGILDRPDEAQAIRERARQTILETYDLQSVCLPRQVRLIEEVAAGNMPPDLG